MDDMAMLRLQVEWGSDEALDLDPIDRLRAPDALAGLGHREPAATDDRTPAADRSGEYRIARRPTQPQAAVVATPAERAAALAAQADSLDALRAVVGACDLCPLRDTASNLVFAEGDPSADVLVIGEPPGVEEDRGGHPFAGADGVLLDRMLASIGLARASLLCAPLIPWRPPGGRAPYPGEMQVCLPFLHRLIVLSAPRYLVLVSSLAVRSLMPDRSRRRRGNPEWESMAIPGLSRSLPIMAIPNLADVRDNPARRREAWAGLRLLRRAMDDISQKRDS